MNKLEKELAQLGLEKEKEVRAAIESTYSNALEEIGERIKALMADEMTQSKVYRIEFQKALRGHVSAVLDSLRNSEYDSISEYIKGCYEDGFIGTLYTLNKSEIPIILPMAQEQIVKALILDSKISEGLYTRLGNDTKELKRRISAEISRGLSTAMPYADIARNIKNQSNMPISNAMNIVQTEGHRIQTGSALDVARKAKEKGTDLVKVWDSTLDSRTRPHHRALDGQVREIEECFEIDGLKAEAPGHFGTPSEDCRCRCAVLIKPRWDVDENFTKRNNETGELLEFSNVSDYHKFKEKYWGTVDKSGGSGIIRVRSDDVALENQRYGRNKDTLVNKTYIESGEYRRKFDNATDNKKVNKALYDSAKQALKHRSGTVYEDMYWIDGNTGKILACKTDSTQERAVIYTDDIKNAIKNNNNNIVTIHTHPSSMPPSISDFNSAFRNGYDKGVVACHDGKVFIYSSKQKIENRLYDMYIQGYISEGLSEYEAQIKTLEKLKLNYAIDFKEVF